MPYFKQIRFSSGFLTLLSAVVAITLASVTSASALAEDMLPLGTKAPQFELPATGGQTISLRQFRNKKHLIVVFYPGDNTPGCTIQLCALRDEYSKVKALDAEVLASNPASVKSHEGFAKRQQYPFPIVADTQHQMAKNYGVDGLLGFNRRTVYIIDKQGIIRFADRGMPSVETLLSTLKKLQSS